MRATRTALYLIRLLLGITFVVYGIIKVPGGQFIYDDFVIDSRTTDGPTLVWSFFGYSPVYGRLIGLAELVPGVLLLFRRTQALGAVILLPVTANISVMDFCFDFPPVKYFSLLLTLLCAAAVACEYRRLLPLVAAEEPAALAVTAAGPTRGRAVWRAALVLVGVPAALFVINLIGASVTAGPEAAARAWCVAQGWPEKDLIPRGWRATGWSGIDRHGRVSIELRGSQPPTMLDVTVRRPHSFVGWQVTDYCERQIGAGPSSAGAVP
jgi:hypothetical protein